MTSQNKGIAWTSPENTRLVTIAAHVDAGKTTLADQLLEHNGIISERAAGTLRYLDSDPEEQRRGITMRSSAVGLRYQYTAAKKKQGKQQQTNLPMIVHLVDSPGHTDFLREVSSSMVACDSAIVLLDAVEGLTARTNQVFRETARNQLVPVLVINKIDRYFTDLHLSATDAYLRLRGLLETVNAATAAMIGSMIQDTHDVDMHETELDKMEQRWTFEPSVGNVVFASAIHGWGFTVPGLARHLFRSQQIPVKPALLKQYLFGDFRYNHDGKWIKWKQSSLDTQPLFAEAALQPLWDIYQGLETASQVLGLNNTNGSVPASSRITLDTPGMDDISRAVANSGDNMQLESILSKFGGNPDTCLKSILRRYRPLGDAVLCTVCEYCPSPAESAASTRAETLRLEEETTAPEIQAAVANCSTGSVPTVAHVCKFFLTDRSNVRDADQDLTTNGSSKVIFGLARILSGELVSGESYNVAGRSSPTQQPFVLRVYLLMGSSFVHVDRVPAGHLCAVYGLESVGSPTLTLSSSLSSAPLRTNDDHRSAAHRPLVKVHVEVVQSSDAEVLERGLNQLRLVDGAVEVSTTERGERLLACLGELHLEQTILDLKNTYCARNIDLRISDPIVDFAETTVWFTEPAETLNHPSHSPPLRQTTIPPYREEEGIRLAHHGRCRAVLPGRGGALRIRLLPFAAPVFLALQRKCAANEDSHDELQRIGRALGMEQGNEPEVVLQHILRSLHHVDEQSGNAMMLSEGLISGRLVRGVEADEIYVPKENESENGNCISSAEFDLYSSVRDRCFNGDAAPLSTMEATDPDLAAASIWESSIRGSLIAGFETAVRAGPVCEEPIRRILVLVESVEIAVKPSNNGNLQSSKPLAGGMVVSAMRSGIRCALLSRPVRLVEAYLRLTLHTPLTGLGSLYQVLSKRRGKVLEDSMVDGTDLLLITALVPQAEAFGLAPELLRKTSGEVTAPEMLFSHWERLDVDPFWVPTSEEEREDFGELQNVGDSSTGIDNTALSYIRSVRKRKGLTVDSSRTIANAEKQRTLKR